MSKQTQPLTWAQLGGELLLKSPNGTQLILKTDEVSGGVRVEQHVLQLDAAALAVTPIGVGVLVLNAAEEAPRA